MRHLSTRSDARIMPVDKTLEGHAKKKVFTSPLGCPPAPPAQTYTQARDKEGNLLVAAHFGCTFFSLSHLRR